jgi:hypothetical protein
MDQYVRHVSLLVQYDPVLLGCENHMVVNTWMGTRVGQIFSEKEVKEASVCESLTN